MNKGDFTAGRGRKPAVLDKVDMSLDDIIRLNKKEQQLKRKQATMNHRPVKMKGFPTGGKVVWSRNGGPAPRVGGVSRGGATNLQNRRVPPQPGRRRGQGVISRLAARRPTALLRRLNRAAISQRTRPKPRPLIQRSETQYRKPEFQRRPSRQPDLQRGQSVTSGRRPFALRRRPLPTVQQTQKEARQATFLFHRGLKVHAQIHGTVHAQIHGTVHGQVHPQVHGQVHPQVHGQVHPQVPALVQKPNPSIRTRQWRTSSTSNGILTISIDNPIARTQPEPPTAWTLHPPAAGPAPAKVETVEKKIPKGVPLQFDINSVGKPQTSITLNDRFRILKDRRSATTQSSKGSRFVTVG